MGAQNKEGGWVNGAASYSSAQTSGGTNDEIGPHIRQENKIGEKHGVLPKSPGRNIGVRGSCECHQEGFAPFCTMLSCSQYELIFHPTCMFASVSQ